MKIIEVVVDSVYLPQENYRCRIVFQKKTSTDASQEPPSQSPTFKQPRFQIPLVLHDGKEQLTVTLIAIDATSNVETEIGTHTYDVHAAKDSQKLNVEFRDSAVEGFRDARVLLQYKAQRRSTLAMFTNSDNTLAGWNIMGTFVGADEHIPKGDLKLRMRNRASGDYVGGPASAGKKISKKVPSCFISSAGANLEDPGNVFELSITDPDSKVIATVQLNSQQPSLSLLPVNPSVSLLLSVVLVRKGDGKSIVLHDVMVKDHAGKQPQEQVFTCHSGDPNQAFALYLEFDGIVSTPAANNDVLEAISFGETPAFTGAVSMGGSFAIGKPMGKDEKIKKKLAPKYMKTVQHSNCGVMRSPKLDMLASGTEGGIHCQAVLCELRINHNRSSGDEAAVGAVSLLEKVLVGRGLLTEAIRESKDYGVVVCLDGILSKSQLHQEPQLQQGKKKGGVGKEGGVFVRATMTIPHSKEYKAPRKSAADSAAAAAAAKATNSQQLGDLKEEDEEDEEGDDGEGDEDISVNVSPRVDEADSVVSSPRDNDKGNENGDSGVDVDDTDNDSVATAATASVPIPDASNIDVAASMERKPSVEEIEAANRMRMSTELKTPAAFLRHEPEAFAGEHTSSTKSLHMHKDEPMPTAAPAAPEFFDDVEPATPLLSTLRVKSQPKPPPSPQVDEVSALGDEFSDAFGEHLSANQFLGKKSVAGTHQAIVDVVKKELGDKQEMIERLMDDVEIRDEALNEVRLEIQSLRKQLKQSQDQLREAEGIISSRADERINAIQQTEKLLKLTDNKDGSAAISIGQLNRAALQRVTVELTQRYKVLEKEHQNLHEYVADAQATKRSFEELDKKHKELQDAHRQQSAYVQKAQKEMKRIDNYKSTITTQEKVILKMQKVIENKLKRGSVLPSDEESALNGAEGWDQVGEALVKEELEASRAEVDQLKEQITELQHQLESANEDSVHENLREARKKIYILETEISAKEIRVSALEEQMKTSARDYSAEISRLRTKLFEFEISAAMDNPESDGFAAGAAEMDFANFDGFDPFPDMDIGPIREPGIGGAGGSRVNSSGMMKVTPLALPTGTAANAAYALRSKEGNLDRF